MAEINAVLQHKLDTSRWLDSSKQCYDVLYTVARSFQARKIVEVGSYEGCSAIAFCQAVKDNNDVPEVYCVDAYFHAGEDISDKIAVFRDNVEKAGFSENVELIHNASSFALPELFARTGKVDLCFIDADHSIQATLEDYNLCKKNCDVLLFHDVISHHQGPLLDMVRMDGFDVIVFPTRFVEGDNHLVGVALAVRRVGR